MENSNNNKNMADKNYFNVEVFGDYFTSTSQGNVIKPFGPIFLKMRSWDNAQRLARFNILPILITKVDNEFKNIRLCKVLSIKTADMQPVYSLPIKYMSRDQIEMECKSQGIPLRADMYPDIVELRSKLRFARENPDKFKNNEQKNIRAYEKVGDALDMNANVFVDMVSKADGPDVDLRTNGMRLATPQEIAEHSVAIPTNDADKEAISDNDGAFEL